MFGDLSCTEMVSTDHEVKLDRLKNEILNTKVEVHNKIIQFRIWLDEKESEIFREFDQIYYDVSTMVTEHQREIASWNHKLNLTTESFEMDVTNFAKRKDFVAIQKKIQELSSKTFRIPSVQVRLHEEELHAKINTLSSVTTCLPPYQERDTPIWCGVSKENGRSPAWTPVSIAVHPISEDIFVTGAKQNRIQIYSKNGKLKSNLKDKKLKDPWYICLSNTHLFVTCFNNNTIHKFSLSDRKRQTTVQSAKLLSGITVGKNEVFACVCESSEVIRYDMNLNKLDTIQLNIPRGVKMYDLKFVKNNFYILTDGSHILQVFSEEGDLIERLIPNYLVGRTCHLVIDRQTNFILTDTNEHQVKIFSQRGKLIHSLGKKGSKAGEFMYPEGVVLDKDERVIVWDFKDSNRLQIF